MNKGLKKKIILLFNEGLSYNEISKKLRCSKGTISYHCNTFRINNYSEDKIKQYQSYYDLGNSLKKVGEKFKISRQSLSKYIIKRVKTFTKEKRIIHHKSYRNRVKELAVNYKGGKCVICGYNKCQAAMNFHHIEPKEKDYQISGGTKSFESLKKELDKCVLVCRNCHSEIHAGIIGI